MHVFTTLFTGDTTNNILIDFFLVPLPVSIYTL